MSSARPGIRGSRILCSACSLASCRIAWPRQSVVPPVWFGNGPRKAESAFSNNFDSSCMAAVDYPQPVRGLIAQLKQLPGVGPKSAERMAVWLVQQGKAASQPLAEALIEAGEVTECGICG